MGLSPSGPAAQPMAMPPSNSVTPLPRKASCPSDFQSVSRLTPRASTMPIRMAGISITASKIAICGSTSISREASQAAATAKVATLTEP